MVPVFHHPNMLQHHVQLYHITMLFEAPWPTRFTWAYEICNQPTIGVEFILHQHWWADERLISDLSNRINGAARIYTHINTPWATYCRRVCSRGGQEATLVKVMTYEMVDWEVPTIPDWTMTWFNYLSTRWVQGYKDIWMAIQGISTRITTMNQQWTNEYNCPDTEKHKPCQDLWFKSMCHTTWGVCQLGQKIGHWRIDCMDQVGPIWPWYQAIKRMGYKHQRTWLSDWLAQMENLEQQQQQWHW